MDVRCERCRANYVIEDDRVTEAGLIIRCSTCGHTFRVKRKALFVTVPVGPDEAGETVAPPQAATAGAPSPDKREWRVRQSNGNVFVCKELTALQKWIVERKVGRDDEISLSGDQWKRLGDIPELASFFQVVEAADRARPVNAPALTPLPLPPVFPALGISAGAPTLTYPPPLAGLPPPPDAAAPRPSVQPARGPVSAASGAAWEAKPSAPLRSSAPEPAWAAAGKPPAPVREKPKDEEPRAARSGAGGKLALAIVVLAMAAGGAALYAVRPQWLGLGRRPATAEPSGEQAPGPAAPAVASEPPAPPPPTVEAKPPPPLAAPAVEAKPAPPPPLAAPAVEAKPPAPPLAAPFAEGRPRPSPVAVPEQPRPALASPEASATVRQPVPPAAPEKAAPKSAGAKVEPRKEAPKKEPPAKRAKALLAQARKLRDRGKSQQALYLYGEAADLEPSNADVLAGQGWCYLDLSQYSSAVESFEAALERAPKHPEALMGLAETYRYEGRNADAVKYYQKYLAAHPSGDDAVAARNAISQLRE